MEIEEKFKIVNEQEPSVAREAQQFLEQLGLGVKLLAKSGLVWTDCIINEVLAQFCSQWIQQFAELLLELEGVATSGESVIFEKCDPAPLF